MMSVECTMVHTCPLALQFIWWSFCDILEHVGVNINELPETALL